MSIILFQDITVQYMEEDQQKAAEELQKRYKILKSKLNYYYKTSEIDKRLVQTMIEFLDNEILKMSEIMPVPDDFQRATLVEYFETGKRSRRRTVNYVRKEKEPKGEANNG